MQSGLLFLEDESATLAVGQALARSVTGQELITLSGDLGSGKTTLARSLIQSLGHSGPVKSPTFTLVETYRIGHLSLAHFDLYRLGDPEELEYLGIRDYLDGSTLCLIEWPEQGQPLLPEADLALTLEHKGRSRQFSWQANSSLGDTLARELNSLGSKLSAG